MSVPISNGEIILFFIFIISALVCFTFSYYIHKKYDAQGVKWFIVYIVGVGGWSINSAFRTVVPYKNITQLLLATGLILVLISARGWFLFSLEYSGRTDEMKKTRIVTGFFVFVISLILISNPIHNFVWPNVVKHTTESYVYFTVEKGMGHHLFTIGVGYLFMISGVYIFAKMVRSTYHIRSGVWVIAAFFLLVLGNIFPLIVELPIKHSTTVTPIGAILFAFAAMNGVRHSLFDVRPVATRNIIKNMNDPVAILDRDKKIVTVNESFKDEFIHDNNNIVGEKIHEYLPDDDTMIIPNKTIQIEVTTPDKSTTRFFTLNTSHVNNGPHTLGYTVVFRDITETEKSKRELNRQNKHLDEFADSVAHDLRNPLTVAQGYTELIESQISQIPDENKYDIDIEKIESNFTQIHKTHEQMTQIINDFLKVIQSGKPIDNAAVINLESIVQKAQSRYKNIKPNVNVKCEKNARIIAEEYRTVLIFATIFRFTASRANDNPIDVTVSYDEEENQVIITDYGPAIPDDELERLVEYGFTTDYRGKGLGLSVAKTLSEAHKWEITVNKTENKNTVIKISNVKNPNTTQ